MEFAGVSGRKSDHVLPVHGTDSPERPAKSGHARMHPYARGRTRRRLRTCLPPRFSSDGYGFSVAVADGRHIVLDKAYGAGVTRETVFNIASLSKQFTATAILKLASQGPLGLDDPIGRYFLSAPAAIAQVTLDELLAHTSGLSDDYALYDAHPPLARNDYIRRVLERPLAGPPGRKWRYSNDGYALLAKIVELASGVPFKDYLRKYLFAPAALRETGFIGDRRWPASRRNIPSGGSVPPFAWRDRWAGGYGASGILSTPSDLLRWQRALDAGKILAPLWRAKLTEAAVDVFPPTLAYARGWWRRTVTLDGAATLNIFHSGHEDDGSNAWFSHYPGRGLTLVFLSGQSLDDYPLRESLFSAGSRPGVLETMAFGGEMPPPPPVIAAGNLRTLAGRYRIDDADWLEIEDKNPFLKVISHGQTAFDILLPDAVRREAASLLAAATGQTRAILNGLSRANSALFIQAVGQRDDGTVLNPPPVVDGFEILGSAPVAEIAAGHGDVVTFVLIRGTLGVEIQHWYWSGGQLLNVYASAAPIVPLFRRTTARTFANVNPFRHDSAFLRFEAGGLVAGTAGARRVVAP